MVNYTSIIMLHYRKNRVRLDLARESIDSLLQNTTAPYELIFEDNTQNNRYFEARNAGVARAKGKYLAFVDDDIKFLPGWLEECIEILQRGKKEKLIATPIHTFIRWHQRFEQPKGRDGRRRNLRSGSNCMVMTRESFTDIGPFPAGLPKAGTPRPGTLYCDMQVAHGYVVVMTREPRAIDLGYRKHSY